MTVGYCETGGGEFLCVQCKCIITRPAYCWPCGVGNRDSTFWCRLCGLEGETDIHQACLEKAQALCGFKRPVIEDMEGLD